MKNYLVNTYSSLGRSARRRRGSKGFTAVEIAMVATVIAILALLALPIFRDRAEAAREAAVLDEMSSIAKAMLLAEADLGFKPRLQDLDNPSPVDQGSGLNTVTVWNGSVASAANLQANWEGPYLAFSTKNSATLGSATIQQYIYDTASNTGFIYIIGTGQTRGTAASEEPDDLLQRYPLDPWGSPYAFFGDSPFFGSSESNFNTNFVLSLGPDGVAGASSPSIGVDQDPYQRFDGSGPGVLGDPTLETSDIDTPGDFIYRF